MYKNKKIVAIIPARKGSKGIPNKNIIKLNGIPLIEHSILQAKNSKLIDKVIVSTDSEIIFKIAEDCGVDIKGLRPKEYSSDTAILYDVLKYEVKNHLLVENNYEILILLQPTSPLRTSLMIDDSLIKFIDENQKSAVSVSEVREHPIFMRTINERNQLVQLLKINSTVRRQDLPQYFKVNGMIYINWISDIMNGFVSLNDNTSPIFIPNQYDIDIDTEQDFLVAEQLLKNTNERESGDIK